MKLKVNVIQIQWTVDAFHIEIYQETDTENARLAVV